MSSTQSTSRPQRTRSARKDSNNEPARESRAKTVEEPMMVSSEQRRSMIAQFAYLRAERRGFEAGDPLTDWLESEKEVDALLSRSAE